jgi:hypothetical protein
MQLLLDIPDNKVSFFMELLKNFDYVKVKKRAENVFSPAQIKMIEEERRKVKEDPAYGLDWEEARKTLKLD